MSTFPKYQLKRTTKAQKEEHHIWVNLNEFRKQFWMYTLPQNISDFLFESVPDWADESAVWDSEEEYNAAKVIQKQGYERLKEEGRQEGIREREMKEAMKKDEDEMRSRIKIMKARILNDVDDE